MYLDESGDLLREYRETPQAGQTWYKITIDQTGVTEETPVEELVLGLMVIPLKEVKQDRVVLGNGVEAPMCLLLAHAHPIIDVAQELFVVEANKRRAKYGLPPLFLHKMREK
jgi:hypothetical protein